MESKKSLAGDWSDFEKRNLVNTMRFTKNMFVSVACWLLYATVGNAKHSTTFLRTSNALKVSGGGPALSAKTLPQPSKRAAPWSRKSLSTPAKSGTQVAAGKQAMDSFLTRESRNTFICKNQQICIVLTWGIMAASHYDLLLSPK